ncbi:MAG: membrane lipoprotein lipid attachment site-containing protein [Mucilaginibacter sp.]|nr:membrane lipoprotein lipid attachment site-containing protein [Mucilaginibacter sp.]
MKKTLYTLLAALAITGCSKETIKTNPSVESIGPAQAISFNVSDFGLSTGSIRTNSVVSTNALEDHISHLYYSVLDWQESGFDPIKTFARYQQHLSSESNFGAIRDSLQDGRYHINFIGSDVEGTVDVETIPLSGGSQLPRPGFYLNYKKVTSNIFTAYIDTTVAGKPIGKPIVLKRAVSQVTLHINDAIPANASKFVLSFKDYPGGIDLVSGYGLDRGRNDEPYDTAIFEFPITSTNIGKKNMEVSVYVFPYYYPEIAIDCLDAQGNVIVHKVMPKNLYNVYTKLDRNIQYSFAGNLFGQTANFNISVDSNWKTPVNTPFSIPGITQRIF